MEKLISQPTELDILTNIFLHYDLAYEDISPLFPLHLTSDSILGRFFIYQTHSTSINPNLKEITSIGKPFYEKGADFINKYKDVNILSHVESNSKSILQKIYPLLYDTNIIYPYCSRKEKTNDETIITGDVIVSANTMLNQYWKNIEEKYFYLLCNYRKDIWHSERGQGQKVSIRYLLSLYASSQEESSFKYCKQALKDYMVDNEYLIKFLSVYHTIGNIMIWPNAPESKKDGYYNSLRGIGPSQDFIDIGLYYISQYFQSGKKEKYLNQIFWKDTAKDKDISIFRSWIDDFDDFNDFANAMFFNGNEWIDDRDNIIPLWERHIIDDLSGKKEKISDTDCNEFFKNAYNRIVSRTEYISKKLLENHSLCEILQLLFSTL